MEDEERLTRYEELGVQRDDFNPKYAVTIFIIVVVLVFSWIVLLVLASAVECSTEAVRVGPMCGIMSVGTQWGSLVHGTVITLLISMGLHFKNGRRSKAPAILAFLCYVCALVDVLVVRKFAPPHANAAGVASASLVLLWMIAVDVDVCRAVHGRVLTRGTRKKMPRALVVTTIMYAGCLAAMCTVGFTTLVEQPKGIFITWTLLGAALGVYLVLVTIHLRKVKILLFNSIS